MASDASRDRCVARALWLLGSCAASYMRPLRDVRLRDEPAGALLGFVCSRAASSRAHIRPATHPASSTDSVSPSPISTVLGIALLTARSPIFLVFLSYLTLSLCPAGPYVLLTATHTTRSKDKVAENGMLGTSAGGADVPGVRLLGALHLSGGRGRRCTPCRADQCTVRGNEDDMSSFLSPEDGDNVRLGRRGAPFADVSVRVECVGGTMATALSEEEETEQVVTDLESFETTTGMSTDRTNACPGFLRQDWWKYVDLAWN
ncbi:hypothetical protein C8F04DRAFT_1196052 [Mycena alexandri]|uniref:Uncharacterized protein n=1 Tax=Mycena alexandri TaxID=1745969 RepID=A0AAD6S5H7_9AGAR|nr:hypothetical protein C8F04DRAFT_1196052 [Mycena alexandri]